MNGVVFKETVEANEKGDLIPLGTEYQIINVESKSTIGSVGVHRTVIAYNHDMTDYPEDLFTENYVFIEITNE